MSFRDDLRNALTPELFEQVTEQLGDDFNYDVVPRTRLNKVIRQRNDLKDERDDALEQLSAFTQQGGNRKPNPQQLTQQQPHKEDEPDLEQLKAQYEQEKADAIKGIKIQYAGLDMLRQAQCCDPELAWGLIDQTKLSFDESGNKLVGIDEQITAMKEAKPYLYPSQTAGGRQGAVTGTGKTGGSSQQGTVTTKQDFLKLSYQEQLKFKEANPEIFKAFMAEK